MKLKKSLTAALVALGITVALSAEDSKAPAAATPSASTAAAPAAPAAPATPQFTEEQLLETFGWYIAKQSGLSELEFSKEQTQSIIKGIVAAAEGKDAPYDLKAIGPEMVKFMQAKQHQYMDKVSQQSMAEGEKFWKDIKAKQGVTVLPDGLAFEVVQPGTGAYPKPTDIVKVQYTGTLVNGTKFDSSYDHDGGGVEFGLNEVISGWAEGIQKINKGGKIRLYIPPQLAYGNDPKPGIPPGSTLVFDIELVDVKPAPTAAPEAPPTAATPPATK